MNGSRGGVVNASRNTVQTAGGSVVRSIAIIGQGPNEVGWNRWLRRHNGDVKRAEKEAARLSCTGAVGELLAELAGVPRLMFYAKHRRFNLNARWNGKKNGVDIFDETEAAITASTILTAHPEIRRVVCLGRCVGRIFGFERDEPFLSLATALNATVRRTYLLFPHPSGRNRWFNDPMNRRIAAAALRDFLCR